MGYALAASIGFTIETSKVSFAILGDGGFLLTISELAVINQLQLPIVIVVIDNNGHSIQKQTIETWLDGNYVGVSPESGLPSLDLKHLAST